MGYFLARILGSLDFVKMAIEIDSISVDGMEYKDKSIIAPKGNCQSVSYLCSVLFSR
jgi:hypothetical protein